MSALSERGWLLDRWWGPNSPSPDWFGQMMGFQAGVKKWEAHKDWLVKNGYLEAYEGRSDLCRITDKGRAFAAEWRSKAHGR